MTLKGVRANGQTDPAWPAVVEDGGTREAGHVPSRLLGAKTMSAPLGSEEPSLCRGGFSKQKLRPDVPYGPG